MEILVSLSHVVPDVVFEGEKPVRLLLNFGHKAEDIKEAVGDKVDDESMNHFVALWQDPEHPREFVPQGKNLLVKSSI
jgi:hypothetical protein